MKRKRRGRLKRTSRWWIGTTPKMNSWNLNPKMFCLFSKDSSSYTPARGVFHGQKKTWSKEVRQREDSFKQPDPKTYAHRCCFGREFWKVYDKVSWIIFEENWKPRRTFQDCQFARIISKTSHQINPYRVNSNKIIKFYEHQFQCKSKSKSKSKYFKNLKHLTPFSPNFSIIFHNFPTFDLLLAVSKKNPQGLLFATAGQRATRVTCRGH